MCGKEINFIIILPLHSLFLLVIMTLSLSIHLRSQLGYKQNEGNIFMEIHATHWEHLLFYYIFFGSFHLHSFAL